MSRSPIGALLFASLLFCASGCGRAGGTDAGSQPAVMVSSTHAPLAPDSHASPLGARAHDEVTASLEASHRRGQLDKFVEQALAVNSDDDASSDALLMKTEALLATGSNAAAELSALDAAEHALHEPDFAAAGQSLKLYVMARFRQAKPLDNARYVALLAKLPEEPAADLLRYWTASLASRTPYGREDSQGARRSEIETSACEIGSVGYELNAVQAEANGVHLPLVFIDTGSQHNLMTVEAAQAAGVTYGESATQLVGFATHAARPGVLETLRLGGLTLHNVPVLVGDSAQLAALDGQMTLGVELMHHVCFTIDYPRRRVLAEPAGAAPRSSGSDAWQIPLWTFSHACLAEGRLAKGAHARVLVDTGNRSGTFVSSRWARRNLARYTRPTAKLVFKYKPRDLAIDFAALGNQALPDWPVSDTFPAALERLDLVDVLVGRDLLARFQLTIDVRNRVLLLEGETSPPAPTTDREVAAGNPRTDESQGN